MLTRIEIVTQLVAAEVVRSAYGSAFIFEGVVNDAGCLADLIIAEDKQHNSNGKELLGD